TASWLEQIERGGAPGQFAGRWRVSSDLNWRRLKYWRRLWAEAPGGGAGPGGGEAGRGGHGGQGAPAVVQGGLLASRVARGRGRRRQGDAGGGDGVAVRDRPGRRLGADSPAGGGLAARAASAACVHAGWQAGDPGGDDRASGWTGHLRGPATAELATGRGGR